MTQTQEQERRELRIKILIIAIFGAVSLIGWLFIHPGDFERNDWMQYVPEMFDTVQILFVSILLYIVFAYLPKKRITGTGTLATAARLIFSFMKYAIFVAAVLVIFSAWGIDSTTMLVSAGIFALIIGLGAQSLIADIIAGLFIVFDDEFKVGDMVVIDGWRGEVTDIGMRTTKILDAGCNIKIINNSKISAVVNQTAELSVAISYISVSYAEPLQGVENLIMDNLSRIRESVPEIVEGPYYLGVSNLGESGVDLMFVAYVREPDIYMVQRAMNRELLLIFNENGVIIPFPQLVINPVDVVVTPQPDEAQKRRADRFAEYQRGLAKEVADVGE